MMTYDEARSTSIAASFDDKRADFVHMVQLIMPEFVKHFAKTVQGHRVSSHVDALSYNTNNSGFKLIRRSLIVSSYCIQVFQAQW